jgi:hypothetical protein
LRRCHVRLAIPVKVPKELGDRSIRIMRQAGEVDRQWHFAGGKIGCKRVDYRGKIGGICTRTVTCSLPENSDLLAAEYTYTMRAMLLEYRLLKVTNQSTRAIKKTMNDYIQHFLERIQG